jgi:hypothetical protein
LGVTIATEGVSVRVTVGVSVGNGMGVSLGNTTGVSDGEDVEVPASARVAWGSVAVGEFEEVRLHAANKTMNIKRPDKVRVFILTNS